MRLLLIALCSVMLVGCGFHLRGNVHIPSELQTLILLPDTPYTPQQRAIRDLFRSNGITMLAPGTAEHPDKSLADFYQVELLNVSITRDVIIIGTDAQAKQEQIIIAQRYRIVPPHEDPLPIQIISVHRILNVDQNRVLGQDQEEIVLMEEMRSDIAQQLLKRISLLPARRKQPHHENQP